MNYRELWTRLASIYDEGEAKAIVRYLLDLRFGLSTTDIYCGKVELLGEAKQEELEQMMRRLEQGEPIQYILGMADFCGRPFHVEPGVLIPRPETEELCRWVTEEVKSKEAEVKRGACHILDIGTGSGCIAITLALDIADSQVTAWDISDEALRIAQENARRLGANVNFEKRNVIDPTALPSQYSLYTSIVSNPPYITLKERDGMAKNVLGYEPHEALFAPEDDPTIFYRRIADYAAEALCPKGRLYFELNPLTAEAVAGYLATLGFSETELRQDQYGKKRFLKAMKI